MCSMSFLPPGVSQQKQIKKVWEQRIMGVVFIVNKPPLLLKIHLCDLDNDVYWRGDVLKEKKRKIRISLVTCWEKL